ncbi:MAG: Pr6Pr family membrane protein [Janthinobacterium lividum]
MPSPSPSPPIQPEAGLSEAGLAREAPLPAPGKASRAMAAVIALTAWLAISAQAILTVERTLARGLGLLDALAWLSSYLTNLTVGVVAIGFTCLVPRLQGRGRLARFLARPPVVTAIVLYMVFVGLAYNILLRGMWTPTGERRILNETLHSALPVLCAVYWVLFVPRFHLHVRQYLLWLVYPLAYLFITLWRGSRSDFYPYFFIDVAELGYPDVLFNSAMLVLAFLVLMGLFALFNHRRRH